MGKKKNNLVVFLVAVIVILALIMLGMYLHFTSLIGNAEGSVIIQLG